MPFAVPSRRTRTLSDEGNARGVVLLFTGVRYERVDAARLPVPIRSPGPDARA